MGQLLAHLCEHTEAITKIDAPENSTFFCTASKDGSVRMWDTPVYEKYTIHASKMRIENLAPIVDMTLFEKQQSIAVATTSHDIQLYRVEYKDRRQGPPLRHAVNVEKNGGVVALHRFLTAERGIVYATVSGRVYGWDMRVDKPVFFLQNPISMGLITSFVMDGVSENFLVLSTARGFYSLWDLRFNLSALSFQDSARPPAVQMAAWPDTQNSLVAAVNGSDVACCYDVKPQKRNLMQSFVVCRPSTDFSPTLPKLEPTALTERDPPLRGETGLRSLCSVPGFVVLGSCDRNVRVWDIHRPGMSFVLDGPLKGRTTYVEEFGDMQLTIIEKLNEPPRAAASSAAPGARGFSSVSASHCDAVTQMCMYNNSTEAYSALITGARDGVVKIWK